MQNVLILLFAIGLVWTVVGVSRRMGEVYQPYLIYVAAVILLSVGSAAYFISKAQVPPLWILLYILGVPIAGAVFLLYYNSQDLMTFAFLLRNKNYYISLIRSLTGIQAFLDRDSARRLAAGIHSEEIEDAYFRAFTLGISRSASSAAKALDDEHQILMSSLFSTFRLPKEASPSDHCLISIVVPVNKWVRKQLQLLERAVPFAALNTVLLAKFSAFGDMFVSYLPTAVGADYWEYQKVLDRFRSFDYEFKI